MGSMFLLPKPRSEFPVLPCAYTYVSDLRIIAQLLSNELRFNNKEWPSVFYPFAAYMTWDPDADDVDLFRSTMLVRVSFFFLFVSFFEALTFTCRPSGISGQGQRRPCPERKRFYLAAILWRTANSLSPGE